MLLLNYGHPLTPQTLAAIEKAAGQPIEQGPELKVQLDLEQDFAPQAAALAEQAGLSSAEWQTRPILIAPPAHPLAALALLAELHGRMGYFPAVVRLKPGGSLGASPFEFAEIVNLQAVRDAARQRR